MEERKEILEATKNKLDDTPEKMTQEVKENAFRSNVEPKHRDLWQVIYAENRVIPPTFSSSFFQEIFLQKKAEKTSLMLENLGPRYDIPLYNQPCDTQVYHANIKT